VKHSAVDDDLVTMVYHELRAPLGLMASAARSASCDSEDQWVRSQCDVIGRTADRMLRVIAGVIEASRDTGDETDSIYLPLEIVQRIVGDLQSIGIKIESDIPAAATTSVARGSASRFEALVNSLLMSTLDHGLPGAPIGVRFDCRDGEFALQVENQKGKAPRHRGLGLGSQVCQKLASQLGLRLLSGETGNGTYLVTLCTSDYAPVPGSVLD
jgi:light-regulated signal transduction histidine kinase (bacteriophytochrome)